MRPQGAGPLASYQSCRGAAKLTHRRPYGHAAALACIEAGAGVLRGSPVRPFALSGAKAKGAPKAPR